MECNGVSRHVKELRVWTQKTAWRYQNETKATSINSSQRQRTRSPKEGYREGGKNRGGVRLEVSD